MGRTITPKPGPSFQSPALSQPLPTTVYRQGDPIFNTNDQFFTIPQNSMIGQCVENAPVAFLENFQAQCTTHLLACPNAPPFQTMHMRDGQGGVITVDVIDEMATDLSPFVSNPDFTDASSPSDEQHICENVTLALDYQFFWQGNGLTNITLTRTVGNIPLKASGVLTTRYSAVF